MPLNSTFTPLLFITGECMLKGSRRNSISKAPDPDLRVWTDFLVFRNSTSPAAVNRVKGNTPLHRHQFTEISLFVQGEATYTSGSFKGRAEAGNFILNDDDTEHSFTESRDFERINIQIRRSFLDACRQELEKLFPREYKMLFSGAFTESMKNGLAGKPSPGQFQILLDSALELEREWTETPPGSTKMIELKVMEVLIALCRFSVSEKDDSASFRNMKIQEVLKYIDENYKADLELGELAKLAAMSERSFIRHFSEQSGLSPGQYILKTRISNACRRLISGKDEQIGEIAFDCGFSDPNYFARTFRKMTGFTPSQFAREYRKNRQL